MLLRGEKIPRVDYSAEEVKPHLGRGVHQLDQHVQNSWMQGFQLRISIVDGELWLQRG